MKKIIFFIVVFFLLVLIGNTVVSIVSLWSKKDLLTNTQNQLIKEQQEHKKLMQEWQTVNAPSFVEEQARNRLFMGKPGDVAVLLPSATPSGVVKQQFVDTRPIWLQWWQLFF